MTECSRKKLQSEKAKNSFTCDFCHRSFAKEKTVLLHVCEQKRRHMQRDEKPVKLAFIAYQQFFVRRMSNRTPPTYESFAKSTLYLVFVRFGRHIIDLNAVNPMGFIDFLLRIQAPVDKWISPTLYETYIRELNKNETPLDALERNFVLMKRWADESGNDWHDFFREIEVPLAALYIVNGRISPWILFIAASAHELMQRFNPEQVSLIERAIDPEFWRLKIERHKNDVEMIREMLAEHGI